MKADDPVAGAAWEAPLTENDALAAVVRGAHARADDPLATEAATETEVLAAEPSEAAKAEDAVDHEAPANPRRPDRTGVTTPAGVFDPLVSQRQSGRRRMARVRRRGLMSLGVAAAALAAGLGGGGAYAYFTSTGSGSGSATIGTALNVTITTNATPAGLLQPGGTGDLVITATNPNNFPVQITGLALGTVSGCTTPAVSLVTPSTSYLPFTIPKNASSQRLVISGALTMGAGASNDCQNASLTVPLTATVQG